MIATVDGEAAEVPTPPVVMDLAGAVVTPRDVSDAVLRLRRDEGWNAIFVRGGFVAKRLLSAQARSEQYFAFELDRYLPDDVIVIGADPAHPLGMIKGFDTRIASYVSREGP